MNQIDMASNAILRTWDSISAVVRNLNIPVQEINGALQGKTDSAAGFKWEYAVVGGADKNEEDAEEEDDFEDEVVVYFAVYFS